MARLPLIVAIAVCVSTVVRFGFSIQFYNVVADLLDLLAVSSGIFAFGLLDGA